MNVRATPQVPPLDARETRAMANAVHGDPFRLLGRHDTSAGPVVRAMLPGARYAEVLRRRDGAAIGHLEHVQDGLFQGVVKDRSPYRLRIVWPGGEEETEDPYSFGPLLGDIDMHLFNEGR